MGRGQSEVLAVVLLLRIVMVSATAVLVAGTSAMGSLEDRSAAEQDRSEMESIAHNIQNAVGSDESISLSDLNGDYTISEGANVSIYIDGSEEQSYNTGRLEHNGLVYEAVSYPQVLTLQLTN